MTFLRSLPTFARSIRVRLTMWYLAVLAVVLLIFAAGTYSFLAENTSRDVGAAERYLRHITTYSASLSAHRFQSHTLPDDSVLSQIRSVYVPSNGGACVAFANGEFAHLCHRAQTFLFLNVASRTQGCGQSGKQVSCTWWVYSNHSATEGVVELEASLASAYRGQDLLSTALIFGIPATLLIAVLGGWVLASRALSPVEQLRRTAQSITGSDLSQRIEMHRSDELGRLADTLDDMIGRLDAAFKEQRQLTADVSHELRTPLAVIQAHTSLALKRDRSSEEYRLALSTIQEECQHMTKIVGDLLMLARAEAGQEIIHREPVRLDFVCQWAVEHCSGPARAKNITVDMDCVPVLVEGDGDRLRRVVLNLVDNAVKYTDDGGRVHATVTRQDETAVFTVSDTGSGIDADSLPHIFRRFYRTDGARSRTEGGTGLGLAIASRIVEAHEGHIEVSSERGRGSTFTVILPLHEAELLEQEDSGSSLELENVKA